MTSEQERMSGEDARVDTPETPNQRYTGGDPLNEQANVREANRNAKGK